MKNWNLIRSVVLFAAVASATGVVQAAGTLTPVAATKYAAEGLTAATAVTLPVITYTLGVPRAAAANYTLIYAPPAGTTFAARGRASMVSRSPVVTVTLWLPVRATQCCFPTTSTWRSAPS